MKLRLIASQNDGIEKFADVPSDTNDCGVIFSDRFATHLHPDYEVVFHNNIIVHHYSHTRRYFYSKMKRHNEDKKEKIKIDKKDVFKFFNEMKGDREDKKARQTFNVKNAEEKHEREIMKRRLKEDLGCQNHIKFFSGINFRTRVQNYLHFFLQNVGVFQQSTGGGFRLNSSVHYQRSGLSGQKNTTRTHK